MNNSKRVKCSIKNGGSSKRCLLNGVHTANGKNALKKIKMKMLEKKYK